MKQMINRKTIVRWSFLVLLLAPWHQAFAQGSLMINPKRLVLGENKRNDVITLYNNGTDTSSYIISYKHYEMQEDGSFKDVDTTARDYTSADSMLRYFPLEVTLPPHESQAVKVRFMKPKDLAPGEYRSHLYFRTVERAKAISEVHNDSDKTISLSLHAIFGLSIPLIVRYQTTPAKVTIDDVTLSAMDTARRVTVTANLNRTGNESCYGSCVLTYEDPVGKVTDLAMLKGIAVYVPLQRRKLALQFAVPEGVDLSKGKIKLEFDTLTDNPHETTLASAELPLKK